MIEGSQGNAENKHALKQMINTPSDLKNIQPIYMKVWNWIEIGFDTNVKWYKVICNHQCLPGFFIRKVQTIENLALSYTLFVFAQYDGKCFMPPITFRQEKEYSQYIHFNIPLD